MFKNVFVKALLIGSLPSSVILADLRNNQRTGWGQKNTPVETKKSPKPKTDLRKYINGDLEFQVGWRQDRLVTHHHEPNDILYPSEVNLTDTVPMVQFNLNGRFNIYQYIYGRGHVGYGLATSDHNKFQEIFYTIDGHASDTFHFHHGYGFDWLAGGGLNIPIYHRYVQLEPEMGYIYNKLSLKRSLAIIKGPYAGIRLLSTFKLKGQEFTWNIFYSYLLNPSRTQKVEHPNIFQPGTLVVHPAVHGKGVHAYTLSSGLSYKPWAHWSFSLDWYLFHANGQPITSHRDMLNPVINRLNQWLSNQVVVGAKYIF